MEQLVTRLPDIEPACPVDRLHSDFVNGIKRMPVRFTPVPMPRQYMVSGDCVARSHCYADKALDVMFNPVGQVVGQLDRVERTAPVAQRLVEEYLAAVDRLNAFTGAAAQRPGAGGARSETT